MPRWKGLNPSLEIPSKLQRLKLAVIGGLSVSTALTLFFVPNLYTLFEVRFKRKPATTPSA